MSVKLVSAYTPSTNAVGLGSKDLPPSPAVSTWVRNPSWPACEANSGDNKIVGLYAVWPGDGVGNGGNFFAATISGAYTINFGDGTTTNYATGTTANYEFNYNDTDLANTDAPVTFTASTDTVNRTAHGYTNGMTVQFYNIVTTTGITAGATYYVINATADTFKISLTSGGSAIDLVNDGSATLLPYKIATVTITPQAGQNLTSVNFNVRNSSTSVTYATGWLDMAVALPSCTTFSLAATNVRHPYLERCRLNQLGSITTGLASGFQNCGQLQSVSIASSITTLTSTGSLFSGCTLLAVAPFFNTSSVTDMGGMFVNCYSLRVVPLYDTANVTSMGSMFQGCISLTNVPLFNTVKVTNMALMFSSCLSLTTIPFFNTIALTNIGSMFADCRNLETIPQINTALVTSFGAVFDNCVSLETIPLLNTSNSTNFDFTFRGCSSLKSIPALDFSKGTSFGTMFRACNSLKSVPAFNFSAAVSLGATFRECSSLEFIPGITTSANLTAVNDMFISCGSLKTVPFFTTSSVTNFSGMFNNCGSLQKVPLYNTAAGTNMSTMFQSCVSLSDIPAFNTSAVTSAANFTNMFNNCPSNSRIQAKDFKFTFSVASNKLSKTALEEIFTNLPTVATSQTITVTGNYGVDTANIRTVTLTAGSNVGTLANTVFLSNNMLVTGIGFSNTVTVTGNTLDDVFTLNSHGLSANTMVSFFDRGSLTGVVSNTVYYVSNTTANTFQVSNTRGGSIIDVTGTDGLANIRYSTYITSIVTNTSITFSAPASVSGTQSLTFRNLDTSIATHKGWSITF